MHAEPLIQGLILDLTDRINVQNLLILGRAAILLSQRMELIELEDYELLHFFRFVAKPVA